MRGLLCVLALAIVFFPLWSCTVPDAHGGGTSCKEGDTVLLDPDQRLVSASFDRGMLVYLTRPFFSGETPTYHVLHRRIYGSDETIIIGEKP